MNKSNLIYHISSSNKAQKETGIIGVAMIREQIADILRKRIINGTLKSGEKLSERQVSADLNVSTTPVKEAFRQLQAEGLIYTVPRKGSFVSAGASQHMYQVVLLRSAIEGVAAYMAAKHINDELLQTIKKPLMKSDELIEQYSEDYERISQYNDRFHEAIRLASGDEQIISIGGNLFTIDKSMRRMINRDPESVRARHSEHLHILELIGEGRCEEAEQAVVQHIRKTNLPLLEETSQL